MHNVSSRFHLIKSETAEMDMTLHVRRETSTIYQKVADLVCRPGTPKNVMDHEVKDALGGGYALWRVRAIRLGQGGCFSAAAVFE